MVEKMAVRMVEWKADHTAEQLAVLKVVTMEEIRAYLMVDQKAEEKVLLKVDKMVVQMAAMMA